jgi:hypothetical protein
MTTSRVEAFYGIPFLALRSNIRRLRSRLYLRLRGPGFRCEASMRRGDSAREVAFCVGDTGGVCGLQTDFPVDTAKSSSG